MTLSAAVLTDRAFLLSGYLKYTGSIAGVETQIELI
jgi:hypothetical protein